MTRHKRTPILFGLALLWLSAGLAGCETAAPLAGAGDPTTANVATDFQSITDLPIPVGAELDAERSIVLGGPDQWIGRLVLDLAQPAGEVFVYFRERMPEFGWQPVMSVQAKISVLTYVRGQRATTIQIESGTLGGSTALVTVAPRQTQ